MQGVNQDLYDISGFKMSRRRGQDNKYLKQTSIKGVQCSILKVIFVLRIC